jgi:hypothetical protein
MSDASTASSRSAIGRSLGVFKHRSFLIFWIGACVSNMGNWTENAAQSWAVTSQTIGNPHQGLFVETLQFADFCPVLLLALIAGVISDRVNRKVWLITLQSLGQRARRRSRHRSLPRASDALGGHRVYVFGGNYLGAQWTGFPFGRAESRPARRNASRHRTQFRSIQYGETVWSHAGGRAQLAKLRGCRVIGSAGSMEKVRFLRDECGFDVAFDYRVGPVADQLKVEAPDGIDVYFDNVGGATLEAALSALRVHGRIIACGRISNYNDATPQPGPCNLSNITTKRLTMKGLIVTDWLAQKDEFEREVGGYLEAGSLQNKETVVDGIDQAVEAFIGLFAGKNVGKMVVKLA